MTNRHSKRISTLGSRLTSLISVCLVLMLIGIAALTGIASHRIDNEVRRNLGFVIVLERDCADTDVNTIKQLLISSPGIERFTFDSADDILARESEHMGEDIASMLEGNPYTGEFDVKVRPAYAVPDSITALCEAFGRQTGVQEILSETAVIEGVDNIARRVGIVLLVLAGILLIVSVALINNAVSLSVYGRRFSIHTMKLVGATGGFIRRPFVLAGALNGLIAGFLASAVVLISNNYAPGLAGLPAPVAPWGAVAVVCVIITLFGALVCAVTAIVATNRYLRSAYDDMFLK